MILKTCIQAQKKHWNSLLLAAQTLTHSKGKLAAGCCIVAWRARRPIKMPVTNKLTMPTVAQAIEPFPEVFGFGVMMDSYPSLYPLQSHSATLASPLYQQGCLAHCTADMPPPAYDRGYCDIVPKATTAQMAPTTELNTFAAASSVSSVSSVMV